MAAVDKEDYHQGLTILSRVYDEDATDPADALSHYAVCLALIERKHKQAIRLCQRAMTVQFYNAVHYANAVKVFLAAGNRKKAVEVLDSGLKRLPKDPLLMQVRERIGWRRGNVLPFLHRDNPLNVYLGKRRAASRRAAGGDAAYKERRRTHRGMFFWVLGALGLLAYLALLVGIFYGIAKP